MRGHSSDRPTHLLPPWGWRHACTHEALRPSFTPVREYACNPSCIQAYLYNRHFLQGNITPRYTLMPSGRVSTPLSDSPPLAPLLLGPSCAYPRLAVCRKTLSTSKNHSRSSTPRSSRHLTISSSATWRTYRAHRTAGSGRAAGAKGMQGLSYHNSGPQWDRAWPTRLHSASIWGLCFRLTCRSTWTAETST